MNIAILGATSNIAKDLIFSFVKKNTEFIIYLNGIFSNFMPMIEAL